jgi:hypothetical protein
MSSKCVVNVSFGKKYVKGQYRLSNMLNVFERDTLTRFYTNGYPANCPVHQEVPFAFKAYALKEASARSDRLLWLDSCMVPIAPLDRIWEYAEEHGAWFGRNGFKNADWTDIVTLPALFPEILLAQDMKEHAQKWGGDRILDCLNPLEAAKSLNETIEHVVAGAFALDLRHKTGRLFLEEYFRLARETRAFCGSIHGPKGVAHRHDQTAASVICWRLGVPLTTSPDLFAYKGRKDESTVIVADGNI